MEVVWLVLTLPVLLTLELCCVACGKVKGGKVTDEYLNGVLIYDKVMVK